MPRNVRPSFVNISVDGRRNDISTGPVSRSGSMSIDALVRNDGGVLHLLDIDFIGSYDGSSVLVEITDKRTGKTIFSERFNQ